jgi:endogenous inhibitor of DNA gyrase (YacG/DUF329 family)
MTSIEKEGVRQMRLNGSSYSLIATSLGISVNTIKSYCRRHNLSSTDSLQISDNLFSPDTVEKDDRTRCKQCSKILDYDSKYKPKKFCSDNCRRAWWKDNQDKLDKKAVYILTCAHCGTAFESYGNKGRKYCSHACYTNDRFGEEKAS